MKKFDLEQILVESLYITQSNTYNTYTVYDILVLDVIEIPIESKFTIGFIYLFGSLRLLQN